MKYDNDDDEDGAEAAYTQKYWPVAELCARGQDYIISIDRFLFIQREKLACLINE